jgi:hypothetical protein
LEDMEFRARDFRGILLLRPPQFSSNGCPRRGRTCIL